MSFNSVTVNGSRQQDAVNGSGSKRRLPRVEEYRAPSAADSGIADKDGRSSSSSSVRVSPVDRDRVCHDTLSTVPMSSKMGNTDSESIELMPRNSRLTQSMFGRHVELSKSRSRRGSQKTDLQDIQRKHSLERREKELEATTHEAMKQVEKTIRMTQTMHEKDDEISRLRGEVFSLREEVVTLKKTVVGKDAQLTEMQFLVEEQQQQLAASRQKAAQSKMDVDKFKVENMVLTSSTHTNAAFDELSEKCRSLQKERVALIRQAQENQIYLEKLQTENDELAERLEDAEKARYENVDDIDDRSKEDLLMKIRRTIDDKVKWEQYACFLVRQILEHDPSMLECGRVNLRGYCCASEARWEAYASQLLHQVMDKAPHLLNQLSRPNFTDHDKLAGVKLI